MLRKNGYEFLTSSICYFEYMSGSRNEEFDFDKQQVYIASQIFRDLKKRNRLIEFRDILIASSALDGAKAPFPS